MAEKKGKTVAKKSAVSGAAFKADTPPATPKPALRPKLETKVPLYDLTPAEVKAQLKPRDGFEQHVEKLLALYEAESDDLRVRGLDPAAIREHLANWDALAEPEREAAKYAEIVRETRLYHAAHVWAPLLEIYAKAQAASRTNPDVARGIADFVTYMKTGPRKPPAGGTGK